MDVLDEGSSHTVPRCRCIPLTTSPRSAGILASPREGQPGLSLVVLQPHDSFSPQVLIVAAIVQYFYPIIEGHLVVEVAAGERVTTISSATIEDCARQHERSLHDHHRVSPAALYEMLKLARWSVEARRQNALRLNEPPLPTLPRWEERVFEVDGWEAVAARFTSGEEVEFVVPLRLAPRGKPEQPAEFYVCLKKIPETQRAKIFYLRDGITISGIRETVARGLSAFVTVEGGPFASYVRLAENPAHTRWADDSERLKKDYENHSMALRYVKNSVKAIYDRLTRPTEGIDAELLSDIFFLEEDASPAPMTPLPAPGGRGPRAQKVRIPQLVAPPEPVRIGNATTASSYPACLST